MKNTLGIILALIFASLGLLHFYWAAGGRFGTNAAIPQVAGKAAFTPSPMGIILVGLALLTAMAIILGQIGFWGEKIPTWLFRWGTLGIAFVFLLRSIGEFNLVGFFKKTSDSVFAYWDTYLFSPLCLFIAIAAFLISFKGDIE